MKKDLVILVLSVLLAITAIVSWTIAPSEKVVTKEVVKEVQVEKPKPVEWADDPKNPINICLAKGGIPMTSVWDGRLTDCVFAPQSKEGEKI